ncbi:unnamed protein product [Candidula unifasciata]|uniref:Pericentriolar material 1 protein C-terminal domain-containing protein n=1 Tax=Candidula unifasciata TaxID=100452 RepID=A0A8S3YJH1_9EUPU|nr:unnamed protein product [Candidula unifasciata]
MQALMSRQEELNILRDETTKKLMEVKARDNLASSTLAAVIASKQFMSSRPQPMQVLETALRASSMGAGQEEEEEGAGGAAGLDRQLKSNIVAYPESDDEDNSKVLGMEALPNKLMELKRQLHYLKNEFSQISEDPNMETDTRVLVEGPQQLQNKLHELQNKKLQLDMRLHELQLIHSPSSDNSKNNETSAQITAFSPIGPATSHIPATVHNQQQQQQQTVNKPAVSSGSSSVSLPSNLQTQANALTSFADLTGWSEFGQDPGANLMPEMMQELQEKLRCLNEVREQLNQLKSSVQFSEIEHAELEALQQKPRQPQQKPPQLQQKPPQSQQKPPQLQQKPPQLQQKVPQSHQKPPQSQPKLSGNRYPQQHDEVVAAASPRNMTQLLNLEGTDPGDELSDEDNVSASKSGSVWSVLGSWDHDPQVQEKVRKLKSAEENLRQLQDLVSFVQQSPDGAVGVPKEQAGRASSGDVSRATGTYDLNVSVSEGELPSESLKILQRDDSGEEVEDPAAELEKLRRERNLLMDLQTQLQHIQSQVRTTSGPSSGEERVRTRPESSREKSRLEQVSSTPVVTFASNDELYSKIRRQRILHEELRSKKRELEAIMKKDHNRRQYSRNQDNQSDSVSLTTDMFGAAASVDATMATWGGSTADNLENITEDEDGQDRDSSNHREEDQENEDVRNPSRNRSSNRNVQLRGNLSSRTENQQRSLNRQQNDDDAFLGAPVDWYGNIESRLSGLTTAVEALLKKSENDGRQLHVSVGHESLPHSITGPYRPDQQQQQLLQLQNQSLMLSFGQLVQTLTRQQGDIQQLQQQVQALQLQIQALSFEHMTPAVTVNLPSPFRQPQPSPVVSTCSSRPRVTPAAATLGVRPVVIKHQQKPHLQSQKQRNVNNTDLFINHSEASSGFASVQSGSLSLSARHLPQGADKTPADGACSNLDTSQPQSVFQQGPATRKSGKVKKSNSDSTSGVRMPVARPENLAEERRRAYPGKMDDGQAASRAPAVGQAGIRMDGFDQDGSGYSSSQSVSSQFSVPAPARQGDSGAAVTNSSTLFDTLRDTIYTEVASLISQNENRPYFLLELFRDMQRVDSDSMRQQALNSLQELVSSGYRNVTSAWSSGPTWSQSTQTHSETVSTGLIPDKDSTSEDDDDGDLLEARLQEEIEERNQLEKSIRSGTFQGAPFDYAELVDNPSSLSTPTNADDEHLNLQHQHVDTEPQRQQQQQQVQIIMMAVNNFIKKRAGDICSVQLLNVIIRLVASSVYVSGGQEFVRLFQQQLTSVLEDRVVKYQGRRMIECGEELVSDISDVLYRQLADLGLGHNFDDRVVTGQGISRDWPLQMVESEQTPEHGSLSRTPTGGSSQVEDVQKVTGSEKSESEHDDDDAGVSEESFCYVGVSEQSYTVELAQSETKPFTRIGSDEDDDEGDEVWNLNDPNETAVSRDARLENGAPQYPLVPPPPTRPEAEGAREDGAEKQNVGQPASPKPTTCGRGEEVDGSLSGTHTADASQVNVNGSATDNTPTTNEDQTSASFQEKLTQPAALPDSATHSDSVELKGRYQEEQTSLNGLDAVLASLGGMEELAGDESTVLGPEAFLN